MEKALTTEQIQQWKEGTFHHAHKMLGAHPTEEGTHFAVWAPHAHSVSVVGEFNDWDGRKHPMERDDETGVWSTFVPDVGQWALYKFELKTAEDAPPFLKSDPYAAVREVRPKTASLVYDLSEFEWDDEDWLNSREDHQSFREPISIYEVHLASWRRKGPDNNE
jgi:1,4-alpha-glucan branching enzyme